MSLKKILWKYDPHKDGRCDIKIYVYQKGKQRHYSTGLAVLPKEWDERNGSVKKSHPNHKVYNTRIRKLYLELEEHFFSGGTFDNFGQEDQQASLLRFCEDVLQRAANGQYSLAEGTLKGYRGLLRRMKEYCQFYGLQDIYFEDVDMAFYRKFSDYLTTHAGCGLPGLGKHIKITKRLMNMALEEKLHANLAHRDPAFKQPRMKASSKIYLTTDEIDQLGQLDLSSQPNMERERDRFLLAYWFVMRFSDVCRVKREWVFNLQGKQFLRYTSTKTKVEATLPIKASALAMMEKHNYDFSFSGNVQANRELKTIAAMAGINTPTSQDGKSGPKSMFVTTHTARRSAATNMYLEGVSLKMIGDLGGWKDLQSLRTYLRASGLDTAQVAVDLDFFR